MKVREDFVTNSSSASYIICFARISEKEKAQKVIEKFNLKTYTASEVEEEKNYFGELGADWAGVTVYGADEVLKSNPNDRFIIIEDYNDAYEDGDGDIIYDYNFERNDAIDAITNENGFADIEVAEGEGRDG